MGAFGEAVFTLLLAYYCAVGGACFWKEILEFIRKWSKRVSVLILAIVGLGGVLRAQTADANNGLYLANTLIRSFFDTDTQLMYAIGAIVALAGALHVFLIWNNQERRGEFKGAVTAWLGSCIFLRSGLGHPIFLWPLKHFFMTKSVYSIQREIGRLMI